MGSGKPAKRIGGEFLMPTDYLTTDTELTSIANAIRTKGGTSAALEYPADFITAINAISGGGGGVEEKQINFIDYDGTLLHSYTKAEINAMTSESNLPENPSHDGLTAQGWNWTLAQIKNQLVHCPDGPVWVGQLYVTNDGKTRIYLSFPEYTQSCTASFYFSLNSSSSVTIDWGDGSSDTYTSTSGSVKSHSYSTTGDYVVSFNVTLGKIIFGYNSTSNSFVQAATQPFVVKAELGNSISTTSTYSGYYFFYYCHNLKTVTFPSYFTGVKLNNAFNTCCSLSSVVLPTFGTSASMFSQCVNLRRISLSGGQTSFATNLFDGCRTLDSITIPATVTALANSSLTNTFLKHVFLPDTLTSVGGTSTGSTFSYCYCLKGITIPATVTNIYNYSFNYCKSLSVVHMKGETVPSLGTSAFGNTHTNLVIYVPYSEDHSVLNNYKGASNWSTYASKIQEEPQ